MTGVIGLSEAPRLRASAVLTSVLVALLGVGWWFGDLLRHYSPADDRVDSLLTLAPQEVTATAPL